MTGHTAEMLTTEQVFDALLDQYCAARAIDVPDEDVVAAKRAQFDQWLASVAQPVVLDREEIAARIFDHGARSTGSPVRYADAGDEMRRTALAYADVVARALPQLPTRIQVEHRALHAAADGIQALHPGEVKASVEWLRARANRLIASA